MALIVGFLMLRFLPNLTLDISNKLSEKPWKSLGIGFLALFFTPFIVFIVMITIVGIPIGLSLLFVYFLKLYLSKIYFSFWLGRVLFGKEVAKKSYVAYALGLIVIYAVGFIPVFGGLISIATMLLGFGAAILVTQERYQKALKAKII